MARSFTKFPRISYTAFDAADKPLGEVVAKNEHEGLDRARATHEGAVRVAETVFDSHAPVPFTTLEAALALWAAARVDGRALPTFRASPDRVAEVLELRHKSYTVEINTPAGKATVSGVQLLIELDSA